MFRDIMDYIIVVIAAISVHIEYGLFRIGIHADKPEYHDIPFSDIPPREDIR